MDTGSQPETPALTNVDLPQSTYLYGGYTPTLKVSTSRPKQCQCYYGRSLLPGVCQQENANTPCRAPQCREPIAIITPIPPKSRNPRNKGKAHRIFDKPTVYPPRPHVSLAPF